MKPCLVDYKKIINENTIVKKKPPKILKVAPDTNSINNVHILFNLIGILFIFIGFYTLYSRNKQKEENRKKYENEIENLNKKINLIT